ncbi:MAG TPA: ABC transporter substrate-binding protein [Candidatus Binatia bacterium]|jgi:putative ABC transport system substrate-binding protein
MTDAAAGNSKKDKLLGFMLSALLVLLSVSAEAQQSSKMPRIGYLIAVSPTASANRVTAFLEGLHELGYADGNNIAVEYRYAEEKLDRLPALAAELVRLKPDLILTAGSQATRAAKQATSTIPIVMTNDPDPVGSGFVASLARPGGNITGLSTLAPELTGKRLELLGEIVPKFSRAAVFGTSTQPGHTQAMKELELTAKAFNVQIQYFDVLGSKDIETAFHAAAKGRADGVLTLTSPLLRSQRVPLADLAIKSRMPAIYNDIQFVEAGGLIFYGVSFSTLDRRAAYYVDKILKGAQPANLPVERPTKFELVINMKAAKQIGLTIPPNVLARADRVIK